MAIISQIGRRSLTTRALIATIYLLLVAGAVTMIYPFLLMVAGSTKSAVDTPDARVIPPFLVRDPALYQKHMEAFFNESLDALKIMYASDATSFQTLEMPTAPNEAFVGLWQTFLKEESLPAYAYGLSSLYAQQSRGVMSANLREFKRDLMRRQGDDIGEVNRQLKTTFLNWNTVFVLSEQYWLRRHLPGSEPFDRAFRDFKSRQPLAERYYFNLDGYYKWYLKTQYAKSLTAFNQAHATAYASWDQVHLDRRLPTGTGRTDQERKTWEEFVRPLLNLLWIRAEPAAATAYRQFLRAKYRTVEGLNRNYDARFATFEEVPLIDEPPLAGLALSDWDAFLQGWKDPDTGERHILPAETIRIHSVEFLFHDWLQRRYGSLGDLNAALGTPFADWLEILPPQRDWHYLDFLKQRGSLRKEYLVRNYIAVLEYVALHGRAIGNTAFYCACAVLTALIVNPLAAYALSRYRPPSTYKVLLFLMLTMAFPPMVTQIPVFLMLREFDLLNTFWALVLPGLANGYAIFLLKGFFDSLPRELYECAALDGAGEFRIFWQITMSLSKPILAVIALNAFTGAYTNFMMALLIVQDEKMWTIMPWLYQLQQRSGQGVIFASLIIAAVPTFLIFTVCQKVIMRGIVVPVEK